MNSSPLLSICIPTFNRVNILEKTLNNILEQDGFDNKIEIVISDNCSIDNTKEMVLRISKNNPNIKYYCNPQNFGFDKNMNCAMDLAQGAFIKPFNDYTLLNEHALTHIINIIEENLETKTPIFFLNNLTNSEQEIITANDLNEFIQVTSYWACWVGATGIWKDDYDLIENKSKYIGKEFFHFQLLLDYIASKTIIIIDNKHLFENQQVYNKGGYNFFKIFTSNYLSILFDFLKTDTIKQKTYNKEKEKLFKNHIFPYYISLKIKKNFKFDTKNAHKYILQNFSLYEVIRYSMEKIFFALSKRLSGILKH